MIHQISANESNIGDWMSAIGIRRLLGQVPMVQSYCDEYFLPETLHRLEKMGPDDLVIIGGGGLLQEYFMPFWRAVSKAQAHGADVVIWGVGIAGPELPTENATLIRNIVEQCRLCIVRDEMTRRWLDVAGVPAPVPCPSIFAVQSMMISSSVNRPGLLHAVHWDLVAPERYEAVRTIVRGHAQRSGRGYQEIDNRVPQGEGSALRAALAHYAESDPVISSRLHGCILGVAMGCRVLALSSDPKIEAFMRLARLGDWVCGIDDLESLQRKLPALNQQPSLNTFIAEAIHQNSQIANQVTEIIKCASKTSGSAP